jgi:DNA-binding PadR family transcriptional regulator
LSAWAPRPPLGEFEQVVLLAVLRLGQGAWGGRVLEEIRLRTGRRVSRGALYVTLDRLEEKGLLRARAGEATAERGGRPRRHLALTPSGLAALRRAREALLGLWQGLESVLQRG